MLLSTQFFSTHSHSFCSASISLILFLLALNPLWKRTHSFEAFSILAGVPFCCFHSSLAEFCVQSCHGIFRFFFCFCFFVLILYIYIADFTVIVLFFFSLSALNPSTVSNGRVYHINADGCRQLLAYRVICWIASIRNVFTWAESSTVYVWFLVWLTVWKVFVCLLLCGCGCAYLVSALLMKLGECVAIWIWFVLLVLHSYGKIKHIKYSHTHTPNAIFRNYKFLIEIHCVCLVHRMKWLLAMVFEMAVSNARALTLHSAISLLLRYTHTRSCFIWIGKNKRVLHTAAEMDFIFRTTRAREGL